MVALFDALNFRCKSRLLEVTILEGELCSDVLLIVFYDRGEIIYFSEDVQNARKPEIIMTIVTFREPIVIFHYCL